MSTAAYKSHATAVGFSFPVLTSVIKTLVSREIRKLYLSTYGIVI